MAHKVTKNAGMEHQQIWSWEETNPNFLQTDFDFITRNAKAIADTLGDKVIILYQSMPFAIINKLHTPWFNDYIIKELNLQKQLFSTEVNSTVEQIAEKW